MLTGFKPRTYLRLHGEYTGIPKYNATNFIAIAFIIVVCFFAVSAQAELDYMPVDEVRAGMTGYGKTVFSGVEIVKFPLKVRGVVSGAGLSGESLILIELTGGEVEKFGGISQGMSGSPIYIDGKLIGALSLTFSMTDHSLGGVTPIETMIKTMDYIKADAGGAILLDKPVRVGDAEYQQIRHGGQAAPGVLVARPAMAPVAVRGLSSRTYNLLKKYFDESGIEIRPLQGPYSGGGGSEQAIGPGEEIKPGSSVAVQLVRGDVDISAVGTVTAVDGGRVLMFGHPFFRKGAVEYLLADAPVVAIVRGDDMPFKMTNTGLLRGEVVQDRGSALVGLLDKYPKMIPLDIIATDKAIGRETKTSVKIVQDEDILANLILMVILETFDNAIDKIGEGTANIRFSLKISGHSRDIERENVFYDKYDISSRSLVELVDALLMLDENKFIDAAVSGLKVEVEFDSNRSAASIEKVVLTDRKESPLSAAVRAAVEARGKLPEEDGSFELEYDADDLLLEDELSKIEDEDESLPFVYPGDQLTLSVRVRPYRKEPVEEKMYIKVPHDMPPGKAVINVYSGMRDQPMTTPAGFVIEVKVEGPDGREGAGEEFLEEEVAEDSFDEMIDELMERDLNNELVVTMEQYGYGNSLDIEDEDPNDGDKGIPDDRKAKKRTEWVLSGAASMKVKVEILSAKDSDIVNIKKSDINEMESE